MHELYSTRTNPFIDPTLHLWAWEIPVYLFAGGLVAGMMIIAGYYLFHGRQDDRQSSVYWMPLASFISISVGMLALFFDLGHKVSVWRFYTSFQITSPMSWGAWILFLVYPALIANLLLKLPFGLGTKIPLLGNLSTRVVKHPKTIATIGVVNMVLGAALGIYTGILLSSLSARPFWNSSILGILFLTSGLSTAAAFVHLVAKSTIEREGLARADIGFIIIEIVILFLFIIGLTTSAAIHKEAVGLILGGEYTASFWVLVVFLGLLIPLFIQSLAVTHKIRHTPIAPIMVIVGGLILRFVFVAAGQASTWLPY